MSAPATSHDFLERLRVSSLVEEPRLDEYLAELRKKSALPDEPKFLAGRLVNDGLLTSFQAQQLLEGRYKNFIVGKYKLLEPIGAGGMSTVFLCEHQHTGQRLAMKVLSLQQGVSPGMLARFLREARIISSLNHPNIVRAYEVDCNANNIPYIIMDLVEGVSFDELVRKRGALEPAHAAHYIAQAANGLQHLHDAGLIHRDIKPGNLVLDRAGTVKLLDLGLARFRQDAERITEKFNGCAILGTADFISPEQTRASAAVDHRSDIYSLGATFYFLLTGRVPFPIYSAAEKILAHQSREPRPLEELRPEAPPEIAQIVRKMMAKRPIERYRSASEAAKKLARWSEIEVPRLSAEDLERTTPAQQSLTDTGVPRNDGTDLTSGSTAAPAGGRGGVWLTLGIGVVALAASAAIWMASR
jgi:serine/threonine protein kinase